MSPRKRRRLMPTEDWQVLQTYFRWPEQRSYELVRPVVLFGQSPAERTQQTGVPERTVYRRALQFERQGFAGLLPSRPVGQRGRLPAPLRAAIGGLKAEYPALTAREIGRICYARFGRRPSHHTVERLFATAPIPERQTRRFPVYRQLATPRQRRLAIIHLHAEGWSVSSIAGYLQTSRPTVYQALTRWKVQLFADLDDKPHIRHRRALKTELHALTAARRLQENPELGAFRLHAALTQLGIELSPRTCGRILALNRALYGLSRVPKAKLGLVPKAMPFAAAYPHQYWSVDVRYLDHHLGGGNIYCIAILDNYSRAILASGVFRSQDTTTYLLVLRAAIAHYGSPETLVSDSGGVFLAKQAQGVYIPLGMRKEQIERGKPWQDYIETTFNIQRRMADWYFARAQTWEELVSVHDRWMADYNVQPHWAHQERKDGRRSPQEVLSWVLGTVHETAILRRVFAPLRLSRRLDRSGYARFRRWRLYGERGLARQAAALWLSETALTIAFAEESLAQYGVRYGSNRAELRSVTVLRLFETRHRSPQLFLWELQADEWLPVLRLPRRRRQRRLRLPTTQTVLFPYGVETVASERQQASP